MIIRHLPITTLTAAAVGLSSPAAAQTPSTGSASIVSSGGVNLARSQPSQSAALGAVTFVLNTQLNGSVTVQLLGFIASGLESRGVTLSGAETRHVLTGTSLTSDVLSLSLSSTGGAEFDREQDPGASRPRVEVFLAQYN